MILMSYFLALYFSKKFTKPIVQLVAFLEKIELSSILSKRTQTDENNEYGKLYQEVNSMIKRMEDSYKESKIAAVAFETHSGMTITDANHKILKVNQAFSDITGYTSQDAIGKTPSILKSGLQGDKFYLNMMDILKEHNYWSGEIYNRHKDGSIFPEYLTIQSVLDDNKNPLYYVASFVDLTLQKETEAKLKYLKQYDALTGLINKELFIHSIQESIDTKQTQNFGAIISFNIKEFKNINDAYGHNNGDLLLQLIAQRIKEDCDRATLIARVASDVFMLWFENIAKSKEEASVESKSIAHRLIEALSKAFEIEGSQVHVDIYVGISLHKYQDKNAISLFKEADSALNTAKNQNSEYAFFDKQAQSMALNHIDMYSQLREALQKNQFELFYQLQYENDKPYGAEALIRWNHPSKGLISPIEFIPISEKSGLILPMGEWVIEEACRELAKWSQNPKTKNWTIAVNVSSKQFKEKSFLQHIVEEGVETKEHFEFLKKLACHYFQGYYFARPQRSSELNF